MTFLGPLHFFWILLRPSGPLLVLLLLLVGFAVRLASTDPGSLAQTFALALILQMFIASTGYRHAATAGYFDVILSGRSSRLLVASAHFVISVLPGAIAWALLAFIDLSARPLHPTSALAPSTLVAFAYVSTAAWATTLWCRRYTGGGVWLIAIVVLAATHDLQTLRTLFRGGHGAWADGLWRAGAALVCPIILVADSAAVDAAVMRIMLAATVLFFCAGLWIVEHTDVPLVDRFR
jgi:hypothetical protein